MSDDAVSRAMANSPTYLRLAAEAMQEDNVKDLAKAIKPAVDALRDSASRLQSVVNGQRDLADSVKAAVLDAIRDNRDLLATALREASRPEPPEPVDMMPVCEAVDRSNAAVVAAVDRNTAAILAALKSLEAAVMAPVTLETTMGAPTGARKTKRK